MQLEQVKPNKPNFGLIVFCFGAAIIAIFIVATLLVVHYRKHQNPPYNKHPVSRLTYPVNTSRDSLA